VLISRTETGIEKSKHRLKFKKQEINQISKVVINLSVDMKIKMAIANDFAFNYSIKLDFYFF
jgi:hypothetical protein